MQLGVLLLSLVLVGASGAPSSAPTDDLSHHGVDPDAPLACKPTFWRCADGDTCVPQSWICDGNADCMDESDEINCDAAVNLGEILEKFDAAHSVEDDFHTTSRPTKTTTRGSEGAEKTGESSASTTTASPSSSKESSEEHPSLHEYMAIEAHLCPAGQFRCNTGNCINASLTCDGKADCTNGDDEGGRCDECTPSTCERVCRNTPHGAHCGCPHGMALAADGRSCDDIDECLHEGARCSQLCENKLAGYECACVEHYKLDIDGHTCHLAGGAADEQGTLLLGLSSEIRVMPLFAPAESNVAYETIAALPKGMPKHMDLLVSESKLFAAVQLSSHDGSLTMIDGPNVRTLRENAVGINYVAVDWVGRNVYFTTRIPSKFPGVHVCTMDGLFCKRIIEGAVTTKAVGQNYRGLAVNPGAGLVAWIDVYKDTHKIMAALLDGTEIRTVVDKKLDYPMGLDFDPITNDLYFADIEKTIIEKVNLDTNHRSIVLSAGVHHPYDIAFFNGFLYWTDWGTETLKVAALGQSHSSPHMIHSFNHFPNGLALNHSLVQPSPRSNPCDLINCPWICVVVPKTMLLGVADLEARCICPEEYEDVEDYDPKSGALPCKPKNATLSLDKDMYHLSVDWMQAECARGQVCINGGKCVQHRNEANRVDRITCECVEGYTGTQCEYREPRAEKLDGKEDEEAEESNGSGFSFLTLLVLLLIVGVIGAFVYFTRCNPDEMTNVANKTVSRVHAARLPERAAGLIKSGGRAATAALGQVSPMSKPPVAAYAATLHAAAAEAAAGAADENAAPIRPSVSIASASITSPAPSSLAANAHFANPAYDVLNAPPTAAPYAYNDVNGSLSFSMDFSTAAGSTVSTRPAVLQPQQLAASSSLQQPSQQQLQAQSQAPYSFSNDFYPPL